MKIFERFGLLLGLDTSSICSGIYFFTLVFISFVPAFSRWKIDEGAILASTYQSDTTLRDSIIVGVTMSISELLNSAAEFDIKKSSSVFRLLFLLFVTAPNVLLLALNFHHILIVSLIHIRTSVGVSLSLFYIYSFGENILFRKKLFIIMAYCITMSTALCTWLSFSYVPKNIIAIVYFTLFGVGSFLYMYVTFNWLKSVSKLEITNITAAQCLCAVYLVVSYVMCLGQLILVISCGPLSNNFSNVTYLTGNNILVSALMVILWFSYSQTYRLQKSQFEVSYIP